MKKKTGVLVQEETVYLPTTLHTYLPTSLLSVPATGREKGSTAEGYILYIHS